MWWDFIFHLECHRAENVLATIVREMNVFCLGWGEREKKSYFVFSWVQVSWGWKAKTILRVFKEQEEEWVRDVSCETKLKWQNLQSEYKNLDSINGQTVSNWSHSVFYPQCFPLQLASFLKHRPQYNLFCSAWAEPHLKNLNRN